ncbi:MAG: cell division protein FtsQ/DivIB, partial [Planctomycetaceae bacterium]
PPHWVPPDFVEQVVKRSQLPETVCLLDDGVLEHIAAALAAHPWVERVRCVRKSAGEGIVVELDYRRPVAMVNVKQGVYPVDARGILLPPGDFSPADVSRYPAVLNVASVPQGAPGTEWGDATVTGAARLASVLTQTRGGAESPWKRLGLSAILVPDRTEAEPAADELTYQLLTPGQSRIVWGRAPGSDHPGELSDEQKIGRLDKYCQDFGGFDQSHGPYEIDIRHWREISRRPISAARKRGGARR